MTTHSTDVIVIGGGPAGIAAVCRLLASGQRVTWVDQAARPGGQIWRASLPPAWQPRLDAASGSAALTHLPGHAVIAVESGTTLLLQDQLDPRRPALRVQAPRLLLALGARERFLPFPGWTLPGVHGAGGLQALVKNGWPVAGKRVVLAGSGPLLLAAADTARAAGAKVLLIAEQASRAALSRFALGLPAAKLAQAAALRWRLRGTAYRPDCRVTQAFGDGRLEALQLDDGRRIDCDMLGIGFGLQPNTGLASALGCRIDNTTGAIAIDAQQRTSQPAVWAAGECCGVGGVDKALAEGEIAALQILGEGTPAPLRRRHERALAFAARLSGTFTLRPELLRPPEAGDTIVCRCEDVTIGALRAQPSWRDAKLQTRCGMGACQGRICKPIVRDLFGWHDESPPREPLQPAPLRAFIARD
ncbi:FAD-dependent oxidoreductase [Paucibacter sp. R3-3]|uniref:FAD-dependent oxidoreductase n=1 Tax=Roseateles agri TaxID=3098619 RepID=A0ABU5DBI8_9BURK|nr:FAD-dependent oxidoreductase [Paucibacter sp. R3-3]MDY0743608.1 FAD-dependent oxidoreductase [Paucibacter sp. R3-3]